MLYLKCELGIIIIKITIYDAWFIQQILQSYSFYSKEMSVYLSSKRRYMQSASVLKINLVNKNKQILDQHRQLQIMETENTKAQDQNIFSKMLRPPSQSLNRHGKQNRKYQPKFKKPDVQNLIQQNNNLKLEKANDKKLIMQMKLKIQQVEKKVKKTENVNSQVMKAMDKQGQSSVYIEILKKKMHDLNLKCLNAENQIRQLKRLPNASIFQQNSIQKQYLLSETIRLKSLISAIQSEEQGNVRIHDQFVKMLKEENQKLKATIRLLQNDKILLKSRQTIQIKVNTDLKKQIQRLKQKVCLRQAQIQKLNNENKDLLFKKAYQFKKQQQRRQNQEINKLQKIIQQLKQDKKKALDNSIQLQQDLNIIKQKQKMKTNELTQMQQKYQLQVKSYQEQLEQLQFQNGNYKNDYYNLLSNSTGTSKKKKSKLQGSVQKVQYKPIKLEEVEIFFYSLFYLLQDKDISSVESILPEDNKLYKCSQLISIFEEKPLTLNNKEAIKIARYLVEDNTLERTTYDPNATVDRSLAITIIKAGLRNLQECFSQLVQDKWKCLIQKAKKLVPTLENQENQFITKSRFCEMLSKNIRSPIGKQEIQFIVINSFNFEETDTEVMMETSKIIKVLNSFLGPYRHNY